MNAWNADVARLRRVQKVLTRVLVFIAVVALVFTATNVTLFAIAHDVSPWIAWLLDPMVAVALGAVLVTDGVLGEYGIRPGGWATCLRWFTGLATWAMNCWHALWPQGTPFGIPRAVDPAALVLHSIPPVLLIVLAEAITHYRREILAAVRRIEEPTSEPGGDRVRNVPQGMGVSAPGRLVICGRGGLGIPRVPAKRLRPAPRDTVAKPRTARKPARAGKAPGRRTDAELLAEARTLTAAWPVQRLTADELRETFRVGPPRARMLRDALRAERARQAAPEPEPEPVGVAA